MAGRALNSRLYEKRPPANAPAARLAWDKFVEDEAKPYKPAKYGNMGSAGVATTGPEEPPRNRVPKSMCRLHAGEWVWIMEFENGDLEEKTCEVIAWHVRKAKASRADAG